MPRKQEVQHQVSTTGVFHSVPAIFESGPEGIKHVLKMDFATTIENAETPNFAFKTTFSTRHVLLDFSAVQPSTIDLKQIERDSELIKKTVQKNPEVIQQLIEAVTGTDGGEISRILEANEALQKIGFTEKGAQGEGGGLIFLIILVAAALLADGCSSCTAHGSAGNKSPNFPK